jgi:hypothetical protein
MAALRILCTLALAALGACGATAAEQRPDPMPREDEELQARGWHDRVVRLEGEAAAANGRGDPCPDTCAIAARACELTQHICALSESDSGDEGTRVLCEDARPRCDAATASTAARCSC